MRRILATATAAAIALLPLAGRAHDVTAAPNGEVPPSFDILRASASTDGRLATFAMEVAGAAGAKKPEATGALKGAGVDAYVWPTALDPSAVGFANGSGILALAVTAHPDFDDTPLFDENRDGDPGNDGADWHSHWVVLAKDTACSGGLKVRDVSPGEEVLPPTAPGLPIALDSPGMSPLFAGANLKVTVPVTGAKGAAFDAVAARLRVHEQGQTPLLCVTGVYKVASGDLSLPGLIVPKGE